MNERIKELADRAGITVFTHINTIATDKNDLEKFAELIIRECAKLRHRNMIIGGVNDYNRGRHELAEEILKHFGVEE